MSLTLAEQKVVDKLAAILRLADGLDRGHYRNVEGVRMSLHNRRALFSLTTQTDYELELWAARHKADLFEKVFKVPVEFSARQKKLRS